MINSPWPGNIRELKNRIKMGMVMASDDMLTAESLGFGEATDKRPFPPYRDAKETFERNYILKALKMCGGNVKKAAKIAGRDRSTFYDLLNKYEITADSFRDLF
jgi:DNA-binding NtrC family response regulator